MTLFQVFEHAFEPQKQSPLSVSPAALQVMCAGHFPQQPLLPGAYLLGFMKAFADGHPELQSPEAPYWVGLHRCQLLKPVSPDAPLCFHSPGPCVVEGRGQGLKVELHVHNSCVARATVVYAEQSASPPAPWQLDDLSAGEFPPLELLLPHKPPARLVARLQALEGETLITKSEAHARWSWPPMLELAAQTGGLLSGLLSQSSGRAGVVATYDRLEVSALEAHGQLTCFAKKVRRFASFTQVHVQVLDQDRQVCLDGSCTLAMS